MASMGGGNLDPAPLIRTVKNAGYINRLLQQICGAEGLNKVGVKADLQNRIIERIQLHASNNNVARFHRLKQLIEDPHSIQQHGSHYTMASGSPSVGPNPLVNTPAIQSGYLGTPSSHGSIYNNPGGSVNGYRGYGQPRIEFKPSPFYAIEQQLGDPTVCEAMAQHRHTAKISLLISQYPILSRVAQEPNLRILVFCAAEGQGRQDVAFPHQSELKVNGGEIKANLRGLKSKPGSTKPVDITKELRFTPSTYSGNIVEMTYAQTIKAGEKIHQKFYLIINVVRAVPVRDLVKQLAAGNKITEKTVIADMVSKARDADIVATASVLSLKCPLSTLRIDLPCRSTSCRHVQCFDATSYLQLQEQGPTWSCPICNNPAPFETLAVDEYVKNILEKTSKSVDQVIINPDGKWELNKRESSTSTPRFNGASAGSDSDDDIVEITETGDSVRPSLGYKPPPGVQFRRSLPTPGVVSRQSSAGQTSGSVSGKRPIAAVIDLTSSGDEDDTPVRPTKRQFHPSYEPPSNLPVYKPAAASNGLPPRP